MQEVYSQLKGLRGDLDKVKQINQQLIQSDTESEGDDDSEDYGSDSDNSPVRDTNGWSKLEKRYQFLAKSSHQLLLASKDAANVSAANTTLINQLNDEEADQEKKPPLYTVHELNNRLIEEAYIVSKKREYVQNHIGEVDMDILNTHDGALPLIGFTKAMNILKNQ